MSKEEKKEAARTVNRSKQDLRLCVMLEPKKEGPVILSIRNLKATDITAATAEVREFLESKEGQGVVDQYGGKFTIIAMKTSFEVKPVIETKYVFEPLSEDSDEPDEPEAPDSEDKTDSESTDDNSEQEEF